MAVTYIEIKVEETFYGTITINGTDATNGLTITLAEGDEYTLTAEPVEGMKFTGWMVDDKIISEDSTYTAIASAPLTYSPVFTESEATNFTVVFTTDSGNIISTQTVENGTDIVIPTPPTLDGKIFECWSLTNTEIAALTEDTTIVAKYTDIIYTVVAKGATITANGDSAIDIMTDITYGKEVTVSRDNVIAWFVDNIKVGYGNTYTFSCISDTNLTYETATSIKGGSGEAIGIKFDSSNCPELPTIVLAKKNGELLGKLDAVSFKIKDSLNEPSEIYFDVYKNKYSYDTVLHNRKFEDNALICEFNDRKYYYINDSSNEMIFGGYVHYSEQGSSPSETGLGWTCPFLVFKANNDKAYQFKYSDDETWYIGTKEIIIDGERWYYTINKGAMPDSLISTKGEGKYLGDFYNAEQAAQFLIRQYNNETKNNVPSSEYLWEDILDLRLVWCKEWNKFFEITVDISEDAEYKKSITGTSLGEAELSQIMLYDVEINTETDIDRDDYKTPTVIYNPKNLSASLLNRITEKAPHYSIGTVGNRLKEMQRTFSFDDISVYDALQEIAEELEAIVRIDVFLDSEGNIVRQINLYDLLYYCPQCNKRVAAYDNINGYCSECKTELVSGFGESTGIFVEAGQLGENINISGDIDSVKTCFKLEAGDDTITAAIRNINPNGSDYIWYISDTVRAEMSDELQDAIDDYEKLYNNWTTGINKKTLLSGEQEISGNDDDGNIVTGTINAYNALTLKYNEYVNQYNEYRNENGLSEMSAFSQLMPNGEISYNEIIENIYNSIDLKYFIKSELMPNVYTVKSTIENQQEIVRELNNSSISVTSLPKSSETARSSIKSYLKIYTDSRYKFEVTSISYTAGASSDTSSAATGVSIGISNYADEDTKVQTIEGLSFTFSLNNTGYAEQEIAYALHKADSESYDIKDIIGSDVTLDKLKEQVKNYSINRLSSFSDAIQSCLDICVEHIGSGVDYDLYLLYNEDTGYYTFKGSNTANETDIIKKIYIPYLNKKICVETELALKEEDYNCVCAIKTYLSNIKSEINDELNFENSINNAPLQDFTSKTPKDIFLDFESGGIDHTKGYYTDTNELAIRTPANAPIDISKFNLCLFKIDNDLLQKYKIIIWYCDSTGLNAVDNTNGYHKLEIPKKYEYSYMKVTSAALGGQYIRLEIKQRSTNVYDEKEAINALKSLSGYSLWDEFSLFRREDKYSNDNYISDGLNNTQILSKAQEFVNKASEELYKSAELQIEISATLNNLLAIAEFKDLTRKFSVGNWIYVKVNNTHYELRLLDYEIDYDNFETLSITFSDIVKSRTSYSDIQSIVDSAGSMASSYEGVKRQASEGYSTYQIYNNWVDKGLDATNMMIKAGAEDQDVVIDKHGILVRKFNSYADDYDPCQMKLTNSTMFLTTDNWNTVKTAVGKFRHMDPKTKEMVDGYGVIAEKLIGKQVLGEELGFYNKNGTFTFDENGLVIKGENNTVSINPNTDSIMQILKGTEEKVLSFDAEGNGVFRGTIYATNGEFTGTITATGGKIGSWNISPSNFPDSKKYNPQGDQIYADTYIRVNDNVDSAEAGGGALYYRTAMQCKGSSTLGKPDTASPARDQSDNEIHDTNNAWVERNAFYTYQYKLVEENGEKKWDFSHYTFFITTKGRGYFENLSSENLSCSSLSCTGNSLVNNKLMTNKIASTYDGVCRVSFVKNDSYDTEMLAIDYISDNTGTWYSLINSPGELIIRAGKGTNNIYMQASNIFLNNTAINGGSMRKYKENIANIFNEANNPHNLYNLPVCQFNFKKEYEHYDIVKCTQLGFIADEVEKYYPSATIHENGIAQNWSVRNIVPPMLALIKEHKSEIDNIKEQIGTLQNRLKQLEKSV